MFVEDPKYPRESLQNHDALPLLYTRRLQIPCLQDRSYEVRSPGHLLGVDYGSNSSGWLLWFEVLPLHNAEAPGGAGGLARTS